MDRKDNYDLDLGVQCLYKHWSNHDTAPDFLEAFISKLETDLNKILKLIPKHKEYTACVNKDPYLSGNWGGELMTMTEQAVLMGIPSFQLEIPLKMRAQLFKDEKLSKAFV